MDSKVEPAVFFPQTIFSVQGKVVFSGVLKSGTLKSGMSAKAGGETFKIVELESYGKASSLVTKTGKEIPIAITLFGLDISKAKELINKEMIFT